MVWCSIAAMSSRSPIFMDVYLTSDCDALMDTWLFLQILEQVSGVTDMCIVCVFTNTRASL